MMVTNPHKMGLGNTTGTVVTSTGGAIASAGGLVSGTIVGLPAGVVIAAVGAFVALAGQVISALGIGSGCGPTCVQATSVVNQAEPLLNENLLSYEAGNIDQATAQSNFNQILNGVKSACGGIPGTAGQNCVSDRAQGSCKWKQTASPQFPGQPNVGECWNWYNAYYLPLTYPSVTVSSNSGSSSVGGFSVSNPLMIGGALLLVGLMIGGKK